MKKSREKFFTLMIVPHSGKSTFSIRVPIIFLKILGGILAGILVAVVIFTVNLSISYRHVKASNQDLAAKLEDYKDIEQQLDYFMEKTQTLQEKMKGIEKFDNEIRNLLKNDPALKKNSDIQKAPASKANQVLASRNGTDRKKAIEDLLLLEKELPKREESLKQLKEVVIQRASRMASTPSVWPTVGRVTSTFGYRRSPFGYRREFHDGVDIAAAYGSPIVSAADGMVTFTGYRPGYGYMVTISHGYGFETSYGHTSKILVKPGQKVKKGQVIARVGNTGRSTGPHVHYIVKLNGILKDPKLFIVKE